MRSPTAHTPRNPVQLWAAHFHVSSFIFQKLGIIWVAEYFINPKDQSCSYRDSQKYFVGRIIFFFFLSIRSRKSHFTFLMEFLKIKVELMYNVVPISAVQQHDPVLHRYTFSFLYYLPSWSIPRDWLWFPMLYSRITLLIHSKWNSLHPLTPNSPSIPLPPTSPLATMSLFSVSVISLRFFEERSL